MLRVALAGMAISVLLFGCDFLIEGAILHRPPGVIANIILAAMLIWFAGVALYVIVFLGRTGSLLHKE